MIAKSDDLFLKQPHQVFINDDCHMGKSSRQFFNLNLNQSHHLDNLSFISSYSKSHNSKNNDYYTIPDNFQRNKESKSLCFKRNNYELSCLNGVEDVEKDQGYQKRWKKDKNDNSNKNNSTLSLHISAYENTIEVDSNEIKGITTKSSQSHICSLRIQTNQDLIEFPRQMEENESTTPKIQQFKASQRLFTPNQGASSSQRHKRQKEYGEDNLEIALAALVSFNEYIPLEIVVKKHDSLFQPSIGAIMKQRRFKRYSELFESFPNTFTLSEDRQRVAFARALSPISSIPYTCIKKFPINYRTRAWNTSIFVRNLVSNAIIKEPLRARAFSDVVIPERILTNLKKMKIRELTCIQQYILPYFLHEKIDLLIEGSNGIGRTVGVLTALLSQLHMYKNTTRIHKRGPIAVIVNQTSPFQTFENADTEESLVFADNFCKTLRVLSEQLNISIGFDKIETSKDICVVTFKDIHEYVMEDLSDLKFFIVFNAEKIVEKVGLQVFIARTAAFVPIDTVSCFVMKDYLDPGPYMLRECFKSDAVFISDKS